jgi:transposase
VRLAFRHKTTLKASHVNGSRHAKNLGCQAKACWDSGVLIRAGLWFTPRMERFVLTDAQWAKMEPLCLGKPGDPGRSGKDNRLFVEAVLWVVRTGSPWRDLPPLFGHWNSVFTRFRDWVKADVFQRLFDAVSDEPDLEYAMVDATIVKVHRHGQGAKGGLCARPSAAPKAG